MKQTTLIPATFSALMIAALLVFTTSALAVDEKAAEVLVKNSKCTTCHSVDKEKVGPPYKATAAKYKGKADGEQKLYIHLTTNPKMKVAGEEETHIALKTKDDAEIKNVIGWILSR